MAVTKNGVAIVEIETEKEIDEEAEVEVGQKMTDERGLDGLDPDLEIEEIKVLGTKNQNEAVEETSRCIGMSPLPVLSTCSPCSTRLCRHQGKFLLLPIQKLLKQPSL